MNCKKKIITNLKSWLSVIEKKRLVTTSHAIETLHYNFNFNNNYMSVIHNNIILPVLNYSTVIINCFLFILYLYDMFIYRYLNGTA